MNFGGEKQMQQLHYNSNFQIRDFKDSSEQIEDILSNLKSQVNMPQIQRIQRLRVDQTQKSKEDELIKNIETLLEGIVAGGTPKEQEFKGRQAQKYAQELCQRGKARAIWDVLTQFIKKIINQKFVELNGKNQ